MMANKQKQVKDELDQKLRKLMQSRKNIQKGPPNMNDVIVQDLGTESSS